MSPQMETFVIFIEAAKAGDETGLKMVRDILKRSMEMCPDRDLLMIADAVVALSPKFSAAATNGEKE